MVYFLLYILIIILYQKSGGRGEDYSLLLSLSSPTTAANAANGLLDGVLASLDFGV